MVVYNLVFYVEKLLTNAKNVNINQITYKMKYTAIDVALILMKVQDGLKNQMEPAINVVLDVIHVTIIDNICIAMVIVKILLIIELVYKITILLQTEL